MAVWAHSIVLCNTFDIPKSPNFTIFDAVKNIFVSSITPFITFCDLPLVDENEKNEG